jgi:hypothetical protein
LIIGVESIGNTRFQFGDLLTPAEVQIISSWRMD